MENASKALIIAGAILISILLISVGIIIMNSAGNITDQAGAQTDSMAIQTFNGQFTAYEGEHKTASQVRSLVSAINASNAANSQRVTLTAESTSGITVTGTDSYTVSGLSNTEKYKISVSAYSAGYISAIQLDK